MTSPQTLPDRRGATKARHRRAILDAANELMAERGGPRFTVDELAERADVARRTVFNHFASIDDVVLTSCTEVLGVVIENFQEAGAATPIGDGSRSSLFEELATTLQSTDLPHAIATLARALGQPDVTDPQGIPLVREAFALTSEQLSLEISRRHTAADQLEVELLTSSLLHGLAVIAMHWLRETDAVVTDDSRATWHALLDRLITSIRSGYMSEL